MVATLQERSFFMYEGECLSDRRIRMEDGK